MSLTAAVVGATLLLPFGTRAGAAALLSPPQLGRSTEPSPLSLALPAVTPPPTPAEIPPPLPGLPDPWAEPGQTTTVAPATSTGVGYLHGITRDGRRILVQGAGYTLDPRHPVQTLPGTVGLYLYDVAAHTFELESVDSHGHPMAVAESDAGTITSMSEDGNRIAFSGGLQTDRTASEWVHDRRTGRTWIVSRARNGRAAQASAGDGAISGDGHWVALMTGSDLLTDGSPLPRDAAHDRDYAYLVNVDDATAVQRISLPGSSIASYSTNYDGRYTAFMGEAADTPSDMRVWRWDRQTGITTLVSVADDGTPSYGWIGPMPRAIDDSGNRIVFMSGAILSSGQWAQTSKSVDGVTWGMEIYVHDMTTGRNDLVSVDYNGLPSHFGAENATISGNGTFVAFATWSALVRDDTNFSPYQPGRSWPPYCCGNGGDAGLDIYVANLSTHVLQRESIASDGTQSNDNGGYGVASDDGTVTAFESRATDLSPDAPDGGLFLRTRSLSEANTYAPTQPRVETLLATSRW